MPRILDGVPPIALRGYPMPMVFAEKIITAAQRGTANTRWRDFADVYLLSRRYVVDGGELQEALRVVASHRQASLHLLSDALDGYAELAQLRWRRWQADNLVDRVPEQFHEVLNWVCQFADPALAGEITQAVWSPDERAWQRR